MDGRYGQDELLQELYAARSQRLKDQVARQALDDAAVAEALNMEEYKDTGMMECGCCFDEYPMNRMTHCDEFHFFCLDCAKRNANNEIGQSRYKVKCMDAGGCKSEFTRDQLIRFLDDKAMSSLTRFQQADELQMASLDGLTKCPFCDFAAICPPVEVDKEFRCLNPECEKVSCRLCQLETHVPMSCKEFAKSNKTTVRHAVEEAMTEALVRTCNKCQNKYIKETGCNKMTCTKCGSFQCYVCSKTIENGYSHFNDPAGRGNGTKCPLYDNTEQRHEEEIKKAEKAAIEQVKALHPEIDQGDLKIEVSEAVKLRDAQRQQAAARQYGPYQEANPHHHHHHHHVLQNAVVNAAQAPRRGQIAAQGMGVYVPHGNAQQAHAHAQNVQLAQQLAQRAQIRAQQLALRVQADLANEHALIAQARLQREVVGNAEILPQLFYAPMGGAARGNRDEVNAPLPPWVAQLPGNHYDPQAPMADAHFNWQGPAINPNPFLQYQARPPMQQNHQGGRILGHNLVYQHPHHGAYPPAPNGPNAGAMVARAAQSITAPTVGPRHARNAHRARARAIATARRSQATNAANAAGNQPAANTEGQNYNVAAAPDIVPAVGIHHARAAARRARANALATAREVQLMARDQQSRR
ncbi:MAG: hypothetical protein M1829_004746 [Trizodia sp. TS-e1964]|nr:MAG: hypothetical protein M1829_004746 [Trizodia sp. TS-e1964]